MYSGIYKGDRRVYAGPASMKETAAVGRGPRLDGIHNLNFSIWPPSQPASTIRDTWAAGCQVQWRASSHQA